MPWQQLQISLHADQLELANDFLELAGAVATTLTDAADEPIYEPELNTQPVWSQSLLTALFPLETPLENILIDLKKILGINTLHYKISVLEDQAWERVCMDQFQPICFNDRLWICPSWHEVKNISSDAVIVKLDPGLAFGTGSHPTTRLCLNWLASQDLHNKIIIDYGCGSGILAIAACKLSASQVYAIDNDPQALEATRENALRNHIDSSTLQIVLPHELPDMTADILIANILAAPLITLASRFTTLIKTHGKLALSGLHEPQISSVIEAYARYFRFDPPIIDETWARLTAIKQENA